jgi:hypothetical protein
MIDGYCISEGDEVRREVFFYPRESRGRNGTEEEYGAVVLTEKINRWRST